MFVNTILRTATVTDPNPAVVRARELLLHAHTAVRAPMGRLFGTNGLRQKLSISRVPMCVVCVDVMLL